MAEPEKLCRKMSIEEFREGYVDAYYPSLTGYAYQAEIINEEEAQEVMERILKDVKWIERCVNLHPILHMKDGRELYVDDTNDFPTPTSEENE